MPPTGRCFLAAFVYLSALYLPVGALLTPSTVRAEFEVSKVDASVIRVQHLIRRDGRTGFGPHGTGFVINAQGYAVTNQHVVARPRLPEGVEHLGIFVPDGSWDRGKQRRVTVIWESKALDLAIIHVDKLKRKPAVLSGRKHDKSPKKGDKVFAIGFPGAADTSPRGALGSTLTSGVVGKVFTGSGGRGRTERPIIQHEAGLSPGNSGGPLFNDCNQVIGINTFVATSRFIVRREGGRIVARGAAVAGVYYSPHVSSLIAALKANNIRYRASSSGCGAGAGYSAALILSIVAILTFAGAAVFVVLRRKFAASRAMVGIEGTIPGRRPLPPAGASVITGSGARQNTPREPAAGGVAAGSWVLSGFDSSGHSVHLTLDRKRLAGARQGLVVGRQPAMSDFMLEDTSVSRRHARILEYEGGVGIIDLNSSNGTAVDGRRLQPYGEPTALGTGSTVEIGDVKLKVTAR